jgi:hypothetical protein
MCRRGFLFSARSAVRCRFVAHASGRAGFCFFNIGADAKDRVRRRDDAWSVVPMTLPAFIVNAGLDHLRYACADHHLIIGTWVRCGALSSCCRSPGYRCKVCRRTRMRKPATRRRMAARFDRAHTKHDAWRLPRSWRPRVALTNLPMRLQVANRLRSQAINISSTAIARVA